MAWQAVADLQRKLGCCKPLLGAQLHCDVEMLAAILVRLLKNHELLHDLAILAWATAKRPYIGVIKNTTRVNCQAPQEDTEPWR